MLISQIFNLFDNPLARFFWQKQLSHNCGWSGLLWCSRAQSPPHKLLANRCHHFSQLQPCVNSAIVLWFYNRKQIPHLHEGIRIWWLFSCGFTTGCEFLTFITLSCCNWRPCVISPSAGATLARLPSPRILTLSLHCLPALGCALPAL